MTNFKKNMIECVLVIEIERRLWVRRINTAQYAHMAKLSSCDTRVWQNGKMSAHIDHF